MNKNLYLFLVAIFIYIDLSNEFKIIIGHFTFNSLYFAISKHPLSFFMILSFPYLRNRLINRKYSD